MVFRLSNWLEYFGTWLPPCTPDFSGKLGLWSGYFSFQPTDYMLETCMLLAGALVTPLKAIRVGVWVKKTLQVFLLEIKTWLHHNLKRRMKPTSFSLRNYGVRYQSGPYSLKRSNFTIFNESIPFSHTVHCSLDLGRPVFTLVWERGHMM